MKLDIENKILIPFMILTILPITILGIVSYLNGYQLLMNHKTKNLKASFTEIMTYIEMVDEDIGNKYMTIDEGKEKAIQYFNKVNKENMAVIENETFIMNHFNEDDESLIPKIDANLQTLENDHMTFYFDSYEPWGWTIILGIDKTYFLDELLDIQKYILLMAIIFLVIAMQAIVFIAHSISKPIKKFAEVCETIEINNLEKIKINRSDEIGVLANAFNRMIDQLNASTDELIYMKKFNEDILENVYIGIMTTDKNAGVVSVNHTDKKIFEYYNYDDIYKPLNDQILQTIKEDKNINTVIAIKLASNGGKTIYLDVSTSLLKTDHQIKGAICSFNDITRRKTLENNIVRVDRLASVGNFAAGLAHEIRNPLTGIKTSIQVIKNRMNTSKDTSSIGLVNGITYEIDRINHLITELLDFSKPKQTNYEVTSIMDILKKALDLTHKGMHQKKISVKMKAADTPFFVLVDKDQVEQIFINIITNATDAMMENGRLDIEMKYTVLDNVPFVSTAFTDNGIGIEPEIVEKVFDPFFTTKSKGTGLGLSVVSSLIEENNGKIEIESIKDVGTKLRILFPIYTEEHHEG